MNKVILMGRLTADPSTKYSQGEKPMAVTRYQLAVNRRFKREGELDGLVNLQKNILEKV